MNRFFIGALALVTLLASPALAQEGHHTGLLKVCKQAAPGSGIAPGTPFTFTATAGGPPTSFTVRAGGCWLGGSFPIASTVTVTETGPIGYGPISITGAPNPAINVNLPGASAQMQIGPGVNIMTFVNDKKKMGHLEICKLAEGNAPGPYTFQINPGATNVSVANGSCSPSIQVSSGQNQITETGSGGLTWVACYTYQNGTVAACPVNAQTATVNVVASGSVGPETVVLVFNARGKQPDHTAHRKMMRDLGVPPPSE